MPNKTIYVKDEDLGLFEEAEKLGGESLSGVIAEALRRFVDVKRAEQQGMQEHTIEVGIFRDQGADDTRKVRFIGRLLAEDEIYTGQMSDRRDRGTEFKIYQTKAGKILITWRNWTKWQGENNTADYATFDELPGYDDEISGKALDLCIPPETLPGSLLQEAAEALGQELVEWVE
jgi:hypothetical protein